MERKSCPRCKSIMGFRYGCGIVGDFRFCPVCGREVKLKTTTYPPGYDFGEKEVNDD